MLIILCVMFLTGCTSSQTTYNNQLQSWMGVSEEILVSEWGTPNNVTYITPNRKLITYVKVDDGAIDGNTQPYAGTEVYYPAIETPNYGFPANGDYTEYYCKTSFTIENSQIVDYTFNGDDCVIGN